MTSTIKEFLLSCEATDFGKAKLSNMESGFCRRFSKEIVSLCKSLPPSVQTDAMLLLVQYSGATLGDELDFFVRYYPPSRSILYWLSHDQTLPTERLKEEDVADAVTVQSMAMFLHSLDDHLTDGEICVTPLTLLLRSQAWSIMNSACRNLAEGLPAGERTVRGFIDDYYSTIQDSTGLKSLDSYCDRFRRQVAIGMIAPILLSMKMTGMSDFTRDIQIACGSFGIAWRLLDDIRDIGDDIEKGAQSAVYFCLPQKVRTQWQNNIPKSKDAAKHSINAILPHVLEHNVIDNIKKRICAELEIAASLVEAHDITGLAQEFRCLADPLRNRGDT